MSKIRYLKKGWPVFVIAGVVALCLAVVFLVPKTNKKTPVAGTGSLQKPAGLLGSEIVDKPGAEIPADIALTDHLGQKIKIAKYFGSGGGGVPVILVLGYYECPMLCSLVLNGLRSALEKMQLSLGKDYQVLAVSIDPSENISLAREKRKNYLASLSVDPNSKAWPFLVGAAQEVRRLADAVGFGYRYDKKTEQFAHSAGIFILSPKRKLSKTLYGIEFAQQDVKFSLVEASEGKVGSLVDRFILSCFHYDPDSHRYGVYVFGIVRIFGVLTVLALAFLLIFLRRKEPGNKK